MSSRSLRNSLLMPRAVSHLWRGIVKQLAPSSQLATLMARFTYSIDVYGLEPSFVHLKDIVRGYGKFTGRRAVVVSS